MKINKVEKNIEGNRVKLSSRIETFDGEFSLWFTVDKKYEDFVVDETVDAFLLALFPLAMQMKEDIYLNAPVSEKLYHNLSKYVIELYSMLDASWKQVRIYPRELYTSQLQPNQQNVVTGFSGGIDSFCLLDDYFFNPAVPDNYKVTHLIYNNVGAHGDNFPVFFAKRFEKLHKFSKEIGLPFINIDSNLPEILTSDFRLTALPRNVSAVLILQKLFSKYLYASAYTYKDFLTYDIYKQGYIDPLVFSMFSTETTECILSGSEYSRVEKTRRVADIELSHSYLYVCTDTSREDAENCSVCFKCARTILTLEILGLLHRYEDLFDMKKYKEMRRGYIESLIYEKDPFANEILTLSAEYKYPISLVSRILATRYFYPVMQNIRKKIPHSIRSNVKRISGFSKI